MTKQINDLLLKGYIMPSKLPYGASIYIVDKNDGKLWMCINYGCASINKVIIIKNYPLLQIDDFLKDFAGTKYFSCIDLRSGYHQI